MEAVKKAHDKALSSQESRETVFTCIRTRKEIGQMYLNKQILLVDGEEVVT